MAKTIDLTPWETLAKERGISTFDMLASFNIGSLVELKVNDPATFNRLETEHQALETARLERITDKKTG